MRRILLLAHVLALAVAFAWATPYEVSYSGDTFPEEDPNWHRNTQGGGARRHITADEYGNNYLHIESYDYWQVADSARYLRQMNAHGANERFFCEWRVIVTAAHYAADHGIALAADNSNMIGYLIGLDYIEDPFMDPNGDLWTFPVTPGVFHTYRIESPDMVAYQLFIDGILVRDTLWFEGGAHGYAAFGDLGYGGATGSDSTWDFFRFGVYVVPEPVPLLLVLVGCVCGGRRRR